MERLPSTTLPSKPLPLCPDPSEYQATRAEKKLYLSKVASALYAAIQTRPDIAFPASYLSTFSTNPTPTHHAAADHLLGYLYKTKWLGICFDGEEEDLLAYADASFADNPDRRSTEGYIMKLFGGPILWRSGKQKCVTRSSTEAEIRSASTAATQLISLERLLSQIGLDLGSALTLFGDNTQTIRLLNSETGAIATKLRHIDIHQLWLRQEVSAGRFKVKWVPSAEMTADGLTKRLTKDQQEAFVRALGLVDCSIPFQQGY